METIEWLKITRIRLGLKLEDVAKEMFVTKQTVSNVESGKCTKKSTIALYERILKDHLIEHPLEDLHW